MAGTRNPRPDGHSPAYRDQEMRWLWKRRAGVRPTYDQALLAPADAGARPVSMSYWMTFWRLEDVVADADPVHITRRCAYRQTRNDAAKPCQCWRCLVARGR